MSGTTGAIDVGKLTIPLFVGTVINWFLLGALVVQVYFYFLAFPRDQRLNKLVVGFAFVAEIFQTFGDTRNTIRSFGAGWGNFHSLDEVGWAWFSVPVLGSLIGCIGQLFFGWRIHVIGNGALVVPILIGVLALLEFGAGLWTGVLISRAGRFSRLTYDAMKPPVAWLSATAAVDLIIVAATVYYLLKARQPGFRGATYNAVNRIIRVTVETGVPCAIFAIIDLALFVAFNGNNYHLGTCIWLSKVYSISILVILNSRMTIRHDSGTFEASVNFSDMRFQSRHSAVAVPPRVNLQLERNPSRSEYSDGLTDTLNQPKVEAGLSLATKSDAVHEWAQAV